MKRLLLTIALTAAVIIPAYAHHSFAAEYLENQTISIEGELSEFEYKNPHAWVYVMAKDSSGQTQRFAAEWANTNRLKAQGVLKDTLKPGDHVIITGSPGRNVDDHKIHLKQIERPGDGWKWGNGRNPGRRR
jgi:exonuclease VII large subunit